MMRPTARALRLYCSLIRGDHLYGLNGSRKVSTWARSAAYLQSKPFVDGEIKRSLRQTGRSVCTSVVSDSPGGLHLNL